MTRPAAASTSSATTSTLLLVSYLLLLASSSCAARSVPPAGTGHAADADEQQAVTGLVRKARDAGGYKTTEPLIGILTQPCSDCPGRSYIAASYVKWVEAAGGRVVPIRFYASDKELRRLFQSVNGLVFPGGLTWLWLDAPYVITARKLFNMALEANDRGDVFPIHGTCLGFQLLHILVSNVSRNDLLVETDSVAHPATLIWSGQEKQSRVFGGLPADLHTKLPDASLNLALENHEVAVLPPQYERYPILADWYRVLSTTLDRNGVEYISTIEGKKYPFTGTQWHPEKPTSEFGMVEVPHTLDAVRVSQHIANYFIDTARRSSHRPESAEEELAMLIYSTPPVFSARFEVFGEDNYDGPYQTYYFDKKTHPPVGPEDDEHEGGGHPDEPSGGGSTLAASSSRSSRRARRSRQQAVSS